MGKALEAQPSVVEIPGTDFCGTINLGGPKLNAMRP